MKGHRVSTRTTLPGLLLLGFFFAQQDDERLAEWPALDKDQAKTVKTDVSRLRKARTEEMADQAHAALVDVGAGCAPSLITALGKSSKTQLAAKPNRQQNTDTPSGRRELLSGEGMPYVMKPTTAGLSRTRAPQQLASPHDGIQLRPRLEAAAAFAPHALGSLDVRED